MSDIEGQRIAVTCPRCNSQLKVEPRFAGTRQECPQCGKPFKIPGVRTTATPASSSLDDDLADFAPAPTRPAAQPQPATPQPTPAEPGKTPAPPPPTPPPVVAPVNNTAADPTEDPVVTVAPAVPSPVASTHEDQDDDLGLPAPATVQEDKPTEHRPQHVDARMDLPDDYGDPLPIGTGSRRQPSFTLTCKVCGTRVDVAEEQVDHSHVRCPDCGSDVDVVVPLEPVAKGPSTRDLEGAELKLQPAADTAHLNIDSAEDVRVVNAADEWKPQLPGDSKEAPADGKEAKKEKVPVQCHVCDSRLFARQDQIGKEVTCTVCGSKVRVTPPPKKKPKNRAPEPAGEEAEFKLSETFERPKFTPLARGEVAAVEYAMATQPAHTVVEPPPVVHPPEGSPPPEKRPDALTSAAQSVFEKAKKEVTETANALPSMPANPMITGVLKYFTDPEVPLRTMISCGIITVAMIGYGLAYSLVTSGDTIPLFAGLGIVLVTSGIAIPGLTYTFCSWLAVTTDSSQGLDEIHSWPENWQLVDQVVQSSFLVVPVALACVPAFAMYLMMGNLLSPTLSAYTGVLMFIAVYPIVQLSILEKASLFAWVTPAGTIGAMSVSTNAMVFRIYAVGLFSVGFLLWLLYAQGFMWAVIVGPVYGVLGMVYYRLLGRLMWMYFEKQS